MIRDLIYQTLMGSGKIEFLAICSWGGIQFGQCSGAGCGGLGAARAAPPEDSTLSVQGLLLFSMPERV